MKAKTASLSVASTLLILNGLLCTQQVSAEPKVGVVDMKKLLLDSPEFKTSMQGLKDKFEPRRQEMLKLQSDANTHPNDEDLQREFNRQAIEFQNSAYTARTEATNVVVRSIVGTLRKIAVSDDFDVIGTQGPYLVVPPFRLSSRTPDVTDKVQALISSPSPSPSAAPVPAAAPAPESPGMKIGIVTGLNAATRDATAQSRVRDYARQHGFAIVFDTVYYAKPQFTITDITTDVQALLK